MSGGPDPKKIIMTLIYRKPMHAYLGGATLLYAYRFYETKNTYNYWFGRVEYERRIARGMI